MRLTEFVSKGECGIFGVIRKAHSQPIAGSTAIDGIDCARFRGSDLGAGFASFHLTEGVGQPYRVKVFVMGSEAEASVRRTFRGAERFGLKLVGEEGPNYPPGRQFGHWTIYVDTPSDVLLSQVVARANEEMRTEDGIRARIYSSGRYVNVYKEVGYPRDVAEVTGLSPADAQGDAWIAHTRQPTNSPGMYPIWSHPFASFECAIVHNGDISSFGANMEFLSSRGTNSFVGTDSEVIANSLDRLLRIEGITVREAATILSNPYERRLERMGGAGEIYNLLDRFRGAQLDGPFTVIAGFSSGDDVYLLGLVDRSKFRPIVVGEDSERIYMASEECQIRALSPGARIWTPEPGRFVLASVKQGLMEAGRADKDLFFGFAEPRWLASKDEILTAEGEAVVDARGISHREMNWEVREAFRNGAKKVYAINVNGQRYMGFNLPGGAELIIYGTPGNCLGNFNRGANITVYGSAEDDVADAMYGGRIVIHGDARDVMGQALQGGEIFVRGNVGNRAVIQMRQYRDSRPYVIIGGRADDYFGEYVAGGVAMVLGLETVHRDFNGQLVGDFVGTGMVGGRIYIRSRVRRDMIGLLPPKADVERYMRSLVKQGVLQDEVFRKVMAQEELSYDVVKAELPSHAFERLKWFYAGKYSSPPTAEYRKLTESDLGLVQSKLKEFFTTFGLSDDLYDEVMGSRFTVITPHADSASPAADAPAEE